MEITENNERKFLVTLKDVKNNIQVYDIIVSEDIQNAKEKASQKYPTDFIVILITPIDHKIEVKLDRN